jgi:hypothetical protein
MINNSEIHGGEMEGAGRRRVQVAFSKTISALNPGYQSLLSTRVGIVLFIYFRTLTPSHLRAVTRSAVSRLDLITTFCVALRESLRCFTCNSWI